MLFLRLLLVFVFTLEKSFKGTMMLLVATAVGIIAAYLYLQFNPYFRLRVGYGQCAGAFAYCWACMSTIMLQLRKTPEVV